MDVLIVIEVATVIAGVLIIPAVLAIAKMWHTASRNKEILTDLKAKVDKHVDDEGALIKERLTRIETLLGILCQKAGLKGD